MSRYFVLIIITNVYCQKSIILCEAPTEQRHNMKVSKLRSTSTIYLGRTQQQQQNTLYVVNTNYLQVDGCIDRSKTSRKRAVTMLPLSQIRYRESNNTHSNQYSDPD